jgi:hypothetical protein
MVNTPTYVRIRLRTYLFVLRPSSSKKSVRQASTYILTYYVRTYCLFGPFSPHFLHGTLLQHHRGNFRGNCCFFHPGHRISDTGQVEGALEVSGRISPASLPLQGVCLLNHPQTKDCLPPPVFSSFLFRLKFAVPSRILSFLPPRPRLTRSASSHNCHSACAHNLISRLAPPIR